MGERKLNCWEFKKCGRQPQGPHVKDQGLCPASLEEGLDGVHDGVNAGRACWVITGSQQAVDFVLSKPVTLEALDNSVGRVVSRER